MSGPLDGVKVLEMTSVVLGPWACQILGDLGADVIKVEPPGGDSNRKLGPSRHKDMSALFLTCNRNKRSLVLNLKSEDGRDALLRLAERSDVLVHNFRPAAMERLGLSYSDVKAVSPKIIFCGTYGYSRKGPYGDLAAYDDSVQSASGLAMLHSQVHGSPQYMPTVVADKTTSLSVVYAILAALFSRERTGNGQEIEVPMLETMVSFVMAEHLYGNAFVPAKGPAGYTRLLSANRRPFRTKDGYIAILPYLNNHWKIFCTLSDRPDLLEDERFTDLPSRLENIDEVYASVGEVLATRTTQQWLELFSKTNVPTMVVNTLESVLEDPHLDATGFFPEFDHPTEGRMRTTAIPTTFSETPGSVRRHAPRLGEHSTEVLRELGLDQQVIARMLESGATLDGSI